VAEIRSFHRRSALFYLVKVVGYFDIGEVSGQVACVVENGVGGRVSGQ